jgi:hypothetical protein
MKYDHTVITLPNDRVYRLHYTKQPYVSGEYPTGGIIIQAWEPSMNSGTGGWSFIDNSPDEECVNNFLKAMERLKNHQE